MLTASVSSHVHNDFVENNTIFQDAETYCAPILNGLKNRINSFFRPIISSINEMIVMIMNNPAKYAKIFVAGVIYHVAYGMLLLLLFRSILM